MLQNDLQNVVVDMKTNAVVIIVELLSLYQTKHELLLYYIDFLILQYINIIVVYSFILHLTFILLLIYNLSKGRNGKVKLERSRLWQLEN